MDGLMKNFLRIDDVNVKDKTILLRVDINVPYNIETKKISDSDRIREHAKTIKELVEKGAKVIIFAHQGRKGDSDFIHLNQHAELLSKHVGKKAEFIEDIIGEKAIEKIKSLKPGDLLLLDNVRFLDEETQEKTPEEHSKSKLVQTLAPLADVFVNDAFSAAHRSHASLVGFALALPSVAGRVMEEEINALESIIKRFEELKNNVFVLGGAKPKDPLNIIDHMLNRGILGTVMVSGIVGELFIIAKDYKLGKPTLDFLEKKEYTKFLPQAKTLLENYGEKIKIPVDVAIEENGNRKEISIEELPVNSQILDIGTKTAKKYARIIKKSETIGMKGSAGMYEKKGFELGTKIILEAIASSKGVSLVGGGHLLSAIDALKINKSKFSHVSLGGGALVTYLSGKPMPAIEALKKSKEMWKSKVS